MAIISTSSSDEPGKQAEKANRLPNESVTANPSNIDSQRSHGGNSEPDPLWEEAKTLVPSDPIAHAPDLRMMQLSATWNHVQDLDGKTLGNYHRLEQVGTWRYGTLYEAEYAQLARKVRLITLDAPWSGNEILKRWFLSRSREIAKIQIAGISSSVIECDEHSDVVFIALPAAGKSRLDLLRASVKRATLTSTIEPLSHAFYLLFRGLSTLHSHRIVHGALKEGHIAVGDSTDEIQIDLFATGMPESRYVTQDDSEVKDRDTAQRQDYQQLARAFIALLIDSKSSDVPATVKRGWLERNLPFLPPKLGGILTNLANEGLTPTKVESELSKLNRIRHEPLTEVSWREGLSIVIAAFSWGWLAVIGVGLLLVPVSVLSTPELARKIAIPLYSTILILFVLANASFEALFGKSFIRSMVGYILVNRNGDPPAWKERTARVGILLGLLFLSWTLLTIILVAADPFRFPEEKWSFYCIVALIVTSLLIYSSALLFGGQPFHEWLSGTKWVYHKKNEDAPILLPAKLENSQHWTDANRSLAAQAQEGVKDRIDDILIENELGVGGMGVVYRAFDESLQRPVALKVVNAFYADTDEIIRRFRREASLGSILNHPNIARVYKVGIWQNRPFMAMEYIDGLTLQQIVSAHGPISVEEAWRWIRQAAIGLQEADNHGIIHRDIKPSNLMVTRDGTVKLMDFGISKSSSDEPENQRSTSTIQPGNHPDVSDNGPIDPHLTRVGALLGTPGYMSPEQARCEETDRRGDIYSLGLTLFYMLAGKSPFEGIPSYDLLLQQADGHLPRLTLLNLTKAQNHLLQRMLAASRSERFQNYAELLNALDKCKPEEARLPATTRRAMALAFDFAIWTVGTAGAYFASILYANFTGNIGLPLAAQATIATSIFLVSLGYFIACTVWFGGTPSQMLLGLQVQRADGGKVSWLRASLRFMAKYPVLLLAFALTAIFLTSKGESSQPLRLLGWFSVADVIASYLLVCLNYSTHRKAIHDYLAGTRIVYAKKGLLEFDLRQLFR